MWMYTVCMSSVSGGQNRELDDLKLELQRVVNCHVGAGNRIWIHCRSSQSPLPLS